MSDVMTPVEPTFTQKLSSAAAYLRSCYRDLSEREMEVVAVKLEAAANVIIAADELLREIVQMTDSAGIKRKVGEFLEARSKA